MLSVRAVALSLAAVWMSAVGASAQTPQPFPRSGSKPPVTANPTPSTPASPAAPPPASGQRAAVLPPAPTTPTDPNAIPTEAMLGAPIYPGAEFLGSFDAGRGQRYYLFGTNTSFGEIVNYYKTALKQKGELVYEEPAIQEFDIGKFREESMAFPPSVTVKDYTTGGTTGYLNPKRGKEPARFNTVIQIVPAPQI
jgi:hypothetical protein